MFPEEPKLISQEIEVERDPETRAPTAFVWNDGRHQIRQVLAVWADWGFAAGSPRRKSWRMRRHRSCYRVETVEGAVYEMYHDRGLSVEGGKWILHSRLK